MRIPKIFASWIDRPVPNTPLWSQPAEKARNLRADALGLLLHHEVPSALEDDQLGVGDLLVEAMRATDRRVLVAVAPQDQRGDVQRGEPPLVRRELLEVAGAVHGQAGAALLDRGEALVVLVDRRGVGVRRGLAHQLA